MKQLKASTDVNGILFFDNKILLLYREDHQLWEPPHGKIEQGEHPRDTCKREIYEETGIKVNSVKLISLDPWEYEREVDGELVSQTIISNTFIARTETDKIALSSEHSKYLWATFDEVLNLENISSSLRQFALRIKESSITTNSFSLYGIKHEEKLYLFYNETNMLYLADPPASSQKQLVFKADKELTLPEWLLNLLESKTVKSKNIFEELSNGKINFIEK